MGAGGSKRVVVVALAAATAAAIATFAAAAWTGSSAMLAVAVQALAGAGNQALLLRGLERAARPADAVRPFGYAREPDFSGFGVAVLLFALGAGVALSEGVGSLIQTPQAIVEHPVAYIALVAAAALQGFALSRALAAFNRRRGTMPSLVALRAVRDPALFTVLIETIAALTGLALAAVGIAVSGSAGTPTADGYAAILIGLLMGAVAAIMSVETRSRIVGEAAPPTVRRDIQEAILAELGPGRPIRAVNEIRTLRIGPRDVLVVASVDFDDAQTAAAIEAAVARIEATIRLHTPSVRHIFIEGQSALDYIRTEDASAAPPREASAAPAEPAARPEPVPRPPAVPAAGEPDPPSEPARRPSRKDRKRQKPQKRHTSR